MKKSLLLLFILIAFSCDKDAADNLYQIDNTPLKHAKLGFELSEPTTILNHIAKGELKNNINSILLTLYGNTERKWQFEYLPNSNVISKMIFFLPHYKDCEKEVFEFSYNSQNLITKVISTRKNFCNEFTVIKKYTFNYNGNGLLKSIFMDNDYFVEENYFAYYSNGKIKEIYNSFRGRGDGANFGVQKFEYDSEFRNVIKVEHISGSNYHYTYRYSYDTQENPFKDVFIAISVFMPFIGPAYLSENNVIETIEKNETNVHGSEFTKDFLYKYSTDNRLLKYLYVDNERVFIINK